jgi:hypothetical protein
MYEKKTVILPAPEDSAEIWITYVSIRAYSGGWIGSICFVLLYMIAIMRLRLLHFTPQQ